jgi:hypothetical protein
VLVYAEAFPVGVEGGELREGLRLASIRGSFVARKIAPRGAGVSLSGTLLLVGASLRGV